ncbi:histidinol dehydrogenase [Desulfurococcaceae archaeon AG1]|nr:histidinol dehydrogenase [Desulfurococcaceae archaeon AG1]
MRVLRIASESDVEKIARIVRSRISVDDVEERVRRIVSDVRQRGDEAVIEYAEKLEGVRLSRKDLYIDRKDLEASIEKVDRSVVSSLRELSKRIRIAEQPLVSIIKERWFVDTGNGISIEIFFKPVSRAACYVPGGVVPYISTAIMCGTVAREAGVERLVAFLPPKALTNTMMAALAIAGFDGVYRVGGPYGVAALAYGTESIERVDKIAGPGGIYVTMAKHVVSKDVGIDMLAGPTELLVYVDKKGSEDDIAWHLAAQAEHGDSVLLIAVTTSDSIAENLSRSIERLSRETGSMVFERVSRLLSIVVADNPVLAARFIDLIAPEHVEICSEDEDLVGMIKNYGVLLSGCVSTAVNDYYSGANHILPTMSWARWRGGLSVLDFVALRRAVRFHGSLGDLREIAMAISPIALSEGFEIHLRSISR